MIDVISDFEDGDELFKYALPAAKKISALKKRARKAEVTTVYINNNFGNWHEDFWATVKNILKKPSPKSGIVELLKPERDDYFVLKPEHSAFYSTTLDLLLEELEAENIILTGVSTDICVSFTATDAYMRGYNIFVPEDCVAAVDPKESEHALKYIERVLKASTRPSAEIDF